jgi:hypothetical protein
VTSRKSLKDGGGGAGTEMKEKKLHWFQGIFETPPRAGGGAISYRSLVIPVRPRSFGSLEISDRRRLGRKPVGIKGGRAPSGEHIVLARSGDLGHGPRIRHTPATNKGVATGAASFGKNL